MDGAIPQIAALSVRPRLPDHLQGRPSGAPFPPVGHRALGAPATDAEVSADDGAAGDPLADRASISPEARRLLYRERSGEEVLLQRAPTAPVPEAPEVARAAETGTGGAVDVTA